VYTPSALDPKHLLLVHTQDYIDLIRNFGEGYLDPDTYHREDTFDIATLAVSGGILAVSTAYNKGSPSFALLRPPGHHASRNQAGGFCYFNNIAIGAKYLLTMGANRVAIVDIDVHHGNGTSDIFYNDDKVLYISTHQWGIYPGTGTIDELGADDGEGFNINIPLDWGCGDSTFMLAFDNIILPVITKFNPDTVLVSIGSDAHYADPLAGLTLSSQGYIALSKRLIELSKRICNGKLTFFLEGGYNTEALSEVITGTIALFTNKDIELKYTKVEDATCRGQKTVKEVINVLRKYWHIK
jgi:acetoin utilization deacetylase AcuC-like enzyme